MNRQRRAIVKRSTWVTWSQVDEGFYIGSRFGDFVGYIDRGSDGSYTAFDLSSGAVGSFSALTEAMAALAGAR